MTDWASASQDLAAFEPRRRSRPLISPSVLCAMTLVASASIGLWIVDTDSPVGPPTIDHMVPPRPAAHVYGALVDPAPVALYVAPTFAQDTPLGADIAWLRGALTETAPTQVATLDPPPAAEPASVAPLPAEVPIGLGIPLPPPRPVLRHPSETTAAAPRAADQPSLAPVPPATAAGQPSFFEKLFGRAQPSGTALAYAPEDGGLGGLLPGRANTSDRETTAIYDISAHTVILPNGLRLEAHSGLGQSHDDPRSVAERMHGATPPNVYQLDFREAPFHGVRALRLTPVGSGDTFGRGGLLAHSYMLGPRGDSNGCVVFKNYDAFLQAFESGQVKRLMVVARME